MAEAREAVGIICEEEEAAGAMAEARARVEGVDGAEVVEIAVTYFYGCKHPKFNDIFQNS